MRLLATITIQPHLKNGSQLTPEKLLPFPWDKEKKDDRKKYTVEETRQRFEKLVKKLGDKI